MPEKKIDFTKWASIATLLLAVCAVAKYGYDLVYAPKANEASIAALEKNMDEKISNVNRQIVSVNEQLGELRRLHLQVASTVQVQGKSIEVVKAVASTNTKHIESLPETVATIVKSQAPSLQPPLLIVTTPDKEDLKKKIPR